MDSEQVLTQEEHTELVKKHIINLTNRLYGAEVALDTLLEMFISEMPENKQQGWKDTFNEKYRTKIDSINDVIKQQADTTLETEEIIITPAGNKMSVSDTK